MPVELTIAARRSRLQQAEACLCWLAILVGVWLRLDRFWESSLWLDELATAYCVLGDDWATLWRRSLFDLKPPTYFALVKLSLVFGRSEFFLRLPSVIFGVASIGVLMMVLRRVAGNRAALYGGALYALASSAIYHSFEARSYSMALLLTAGSLYFFARALDGGGRWVLAGYTATTLLACYTHLIYSSVLLGQIAALAGLYLWSKVRTRNMGLLAATQAVLLLLLIPLVPLFRSVGAASSTLGSWITVPHLGRFLQFLFWPEIGGAFAVVALAAPRLWRRRERLHCASAGESGLVWAAVVYLASFPAAIVLARLGVVNIVVPRYLLPSLLGAVILAALAAAKAEDRLLRLFLSGYIGALVLLQTAVPVRQAPWLLWGWPKEDWRQAIRYVEERYQSGDLVLLRSGLIIDESSRPDAELQEFLSLPLCGFYNRRHMSVVNLPWSAEHLESSPLLPAAFRDQPLQSRRIFVLVNAARGGWNWEKFDKWIETPGRTLEQVDRRAFQALEARAYRLSPAL